MATFVFAPGAKIMVATARHGIIDVSDDLSSGTVNLRTGKSGGHGLSFVLANPRRKYDGVFTPNDRVVVFLKRIKYLQVMSGYLNSTPMVSVFSESVSLSASCTLKRLKYALYDPGSFEVANLLREATYSGTDDAYSSVDSNMGQRITSVLVELAGWNPAHIHMGGIPADWFAKVQKLYDSLGEQWDTDAMIGTLVGGESLSRYGSTRVLKTSNTGTQVPDIGPGYGVLPTIGGKIGQWGDPGRGPGRDTNLATNVGYDEWYCSMRWPYEGVSTEAPHPTKPQTGLTPAEVRSAKIWWNQRRILVVNPRTQKAVVLRAVHHGPPSSTGRSIDVSREAMAVLGASKGDYVDIRFALPGIQQGLVDASTAASRGVTPVGASSWIGATATGSSPVGRSSGERTIADQALDFLGDQLSQQRATAQNTSTSSVASVDLDFTSRRRGNAGEEGNTRAATQFIKQVWPDQQNGIGGYRASGSVSTSDHPLGLAIDVVISDAIGKEPTTTQVANGNSIALWFIANASAFGTKYVIWNNLIYRAGGVRGYVRSDRGESGATLGHRDHIHISFDRTGQTSIGPTGTPLYASVSLSDFMSRAAFGGVIHNDKATSIPQPDGSFGSGPGQLLTTWNWQLDGNPDAYLLSGARVFMNDAPVSSLVNQMMDSSLREYCSAPNGDVIAWFPDYFNLHGVLARMVVQTIELQNFQVTWSDASLITHQFVTGNPWSGYGAVGASADIAQRRWLTQGIATVDYPEILETLLNVDPEDGRSSGWTDPQAILDRFGVRVASEEIAWAATGEAEFWAALHKFRLGWASQFSTKVPLSFMPELFPGMILQIPAYGIQLYVDGVTHSFTLGKGGKFSTSALCIAPSTIGSQPGLYGLPRGGQWVGADSSGPTYSPTLSLDPVFDVDQRGGAGGSGGGGGSRIQ